MLTESSAVLKIHLRKWTLVVLLVLSLLGVIGGYDRFERNRRIVPPTSTVSIAVLPFVDLSPARDQEYFADGLTEEAINALAKVPGVRVVARSSSFQFKSRNEDLRVVGRKLGATNIVEGSVQRKGDHIRIMAELVKVDDGFQLWSETYDRKIDDIFSVEDEIARATTRALQVKFASPRGTAVSTDGRSSNPAAYQAYLQGQDFFGSDTDKGNLQRALAYADQAIKLDGSYAPAWALRSRVLNVMAAYGRDVVEGYRQAREDANRAIALNPDSADGHLALGWIQMSYDWDWGGAEASLKKAAELEPGSVEVLRYQSVLYRTLGRENDAIALYEQVAALDPLRARSHSSLGYMLYAAGKYDEAAAALRRALELNPQKKQDHVILAQILLARGRPEQALEQVSQEPSEDWRLFGEALTYHSLDRSNDSKSALSEFASTREKGWACQIAEVYACRGENDKAFGWLDRAYRQRDGGLTFLQIDPLLKNLRDDPRYDDLLRKMQLSP